NLKDVSVSIDVAVPLGLVITELVSNVFKHAFPKDMKGNIKIELPEKKKDTIKLILQDDGIGVAKNFDLRKDGNMGLKNVFNLVEYQLRGNVNYTVENGIRWEIKIEDNLYKKRI
ncbi:MAG: hypothetical protein K9N40_09330, partial [Candidatus Cloacimonetes bacterium]|nr:hypothetical protein [Candidatus Cloacimonadota bacterium]